MAITLLPDDILTNYEVHEWKHACAILKEDFPAEWDEIITLLGEFRICKSWLMEQGGRKSKISELIDSFLYQRGWVEKNFLLLLR